MGAVLIIITAFPFAATAGRLAGCRIDDMQ
jgi:hypothetical protein